MNTQLNPVAKNKADSTKNKDRIMATGLLTVVLGIGTLGLSGAFASNPTPAPAPTVTAVETPVEETSGIGLDFSIDNDSSGKGFSSVSGGLGDMP